jgi:diguanylate cyclase (GGDEF)-like protein
MPVKNRSAKSFGKAVSPLPLRSLPARESIQRKPAAENPKAAKLLARATAVRLAAEVERLAGELEASRARIAELETRIDVDPLTEALNRRGFERELKRSLAYVKRYGATAAVIYLDLDEFKPINDRYGHAAGDALLKAITATLVRNVRASDVVARIGGDEFVVLFWNVTEAAAAAKAAALEAAIRATPVRWSDATLVAGASAGMTLVGRLDSAATVLTRADAAMYARKAGRRDCDSLPAAPGYRVRR